MKASCLLAPLLLISLAHAPRNVQESPVQQASLPSPAEKKDTAIRRLGGTVYVRLAKRLDTKKLKVGEEVDAKFVEDIKVGSDTVVRKNSRLVGRVTELSSRSRGAVITRLVIIFERIVKKDRSELHVYGVISYVTGPTIMPPPPLDDLPPLDPIFAGGGLGIFDMAPYWGADLPPDEINLDHLLPIVPVGGFDAITNIAHMRGVTIQAENSPQGLLVALESKTKDFQIDTWVHLSVLLVAGDAEKTPSK